MGTHQSLEFPMVKSIQNILEASFEISVWLFLIDQDEALPNDTCYGLKGMVLFTKTFRPHHVWCGLQVAIGVISPCVVRAVDSAFDVSTRILLEPRATMSTDVVKAIDLPGFSSDDDETFAIHFIQEEVTGFGKGGNSACTDPLFPENIVGLPIVYFLRREVFAG